MSDLLAIGEALIELNQPREGAPFVQGFGGDTSNAMIAAARLGADAAYFTAVGADAFGQALTALWLKEGVDASRIVVNGGAHTGLYFVTHGPEGHAFSYMRAGSAASRIGESDLPVDRIRATKILHASGISQAISSSAADAVFAAIDVARDAKRLVSYDPNLRLKLWPLRRARAIIHEAMGLCDIALPGLDDGLALTNLEEPGRDRRFLLAPWRAGGRLEAGQGRRHRGDAETARAHRRRARSRRSMRRGRAIVSTAPFSPNLFGTATLSSPRASPMSRRPCRRWGTAPSPRCRAAPTSRRPLRQPLRASHVASLARGFKECSG